MMKSRNVKDLLSGQKSLIGLATAVSLATLTLAAAQAEEATYFTWSGYDVPQMYQTYIDTRGAEPRATVFADQEEALQKMRVGFDVDVLHPCIEAVPRFIESGELKPIDTSRLKHWKNLFPGLQNMPNVDAGDGKVWFVPVDWGNTSVIYRTDLVEGTPDSYAMMWDPKYKGRIASGNSPEQTAFIAAAYAGLDPTNLSDEDMVVLRKTLQDLNKNIRFYWSDPTELEQALASGEIVASTGWNASISALRGQDVPVAFMEPKEGVLTWVCGLAMDKDSKNDEAAYALMDAITSPENGVFLLGDYGYGHSNKASFEKVDDATLAAVGLPRDPSALLSKGWPPTAQLDRIPEVQQMFEEVKAGL
ncbi:MAG: ABC transporter substrate-binding protein [Rhodospirillales bacterium]